MDTLNKTGVNSGNDGGPHTQTDDVTCHKDHLIVVDADERFMGEVVWETAESVEEACTHEHVLQDVFRELQELRIQLFESENVLRQCITKFIEDKGQEKQIWNALNQYSSIQMEGNKKVDILQEQAESIRMQHLMEKNAMSSLERRNRALEEENIKLARKLEKIQQRTRTGHTKDDVYSKLYCTQKQLEDALREIETLKSEFDKEKAKHSQLELQHTTVTHELTSKSLIIKHSIEAGHVLIEDMNTMRKLLQEVGINLHLGFNKLQLYGGNVTDLLHICRASLNELGRELIATRSQLENVRKELLTTTESKNQAYNLLEDSEKLNDRMGRELELVTEEREEMNAQIRDLNADNLKLQEQISYFTTLFNLDHQSMDAELMLITSERSHLSHRLNELQQHSKELQEQAECEKKKQELKSYEATELQKMCWKGTLENNYLSQNLEVFQLENSTLLEAQEGLVTQIQQLQSKLDSATEENSVLRNQLTNDEERISVLEKQEMFYKQKIEDLNNTISLLQEKIDQLGYENERLSQENMSQQVQVHKNMILKENREHPQRLLDELKVSYKNVIAAEKEIGLPQEKLHSKDGELQGNKDLLPNNESSLSTEILKSVLKERDEAADRVNERELELSIVKESLKNKERELVSSQESLLQSEKELSLCRESLKRKEEELVRTQDTLTENEKIKQMLEKELEGIIKKIEGSIGSQSRISELEKDLQRAEEKINESESTRLRVAKLEEELDVMKEKLKENSVANERALEIQKELDLALNKLEVAKNSQLMLENELKKSEARERELSCLCLAEVKKEAEITQVICREHDTCHLYVASLEKKLKENEDKQENANLECEKLKTRIVEMKHQLACCEQRNQSLHNQVLQQMQQITLLDESAAALQSELQSAQQNLLTYRDHIRNMDENFTKFQKDCKNDNSEVLDNMNNLMNLLEFVQSSTEGVKAENCNQNFTCSNSDKVVFNLNLCIGECMKLVQKLIRLSNGSSSAGGHNPSNVIPCDKRNHEVEQNKLVFELDRYKADCNRLMKELQNSEIERNKLIYELECCQNEFNKLTQEIRDSPRREDPLAEPNKKECTLETCRTERNGLLCDLESCIAERDAVTCELQGYKENQYCISLELEKHKEDQSKLLCELQDCKAECSKLLTELAGSKVDGDKISLERDTCRDECSNLSAELEKCKALCNKTTSDLEETKAMINKMNCDLERCQRERDELSYELDCYKSNLEDCLQTELEKNNEEKKKLLCELQNCRVECNKKVVEYEELKGEYHSTLSELKFYKEEFHYMRCELDKCKVRYDNVTSELEDSIGERDKLICELECGRVERSKLASELCSCKSDLEEAKENCNKLTSEMESCRENCAKISCELECYKIKQSEMEKCKTDCNELLHELDKYKENCNLMSEDLECSEAKCTKLTCELKGFKEDYEKLTCDFETCKTEHKRVTYELECLKADYDKLTKDLESGNEDRKKLSQELEFLKIYKSNAFRELEKSKEDENRMTCELDCFKNKYNKLSEEFKNCRTQCENVTSKCTKLSSELKCKEILVNKLVSEVRKYQTECDKAARELDDCRDERNRISCELKNYITDRNNLTCELKQVKQQIDILLKERCACINLEQAAPFSQKDSQRCCQKFAQELKCIGKQKLQLYEKLIELKTQKEHLKKENEEIAKKLLESAHFLVRERSMREKAEKRAEELLVSFHHLETNNEELKSRNTRQHEELKIKEKEMEEKLELCNSHDTKLKEDCAQKESLLKIASRKLQKLEERLQRLMIELRSARQKIVSQQYSFGQMERQLKSLQLEKQDLSLQIHKMNGDLENEIAMRRRMEETSELLVKKVVRLQENSPAEKLLQSIDLTVSCQSKESCSES